MKTASKGIITGILLALARIGGETAPHSFHCFWKPVLESQPFSAHRRASVANLHIRNFSL
jgi:ABC-type phosphate transport system, permease component